MLEEYVFHTKQLNYVRGAMAEISGYLPDARTLTQVDALIATREKPRKDYLVKHTALTTARGDVHEAHALGHKAAVSVHGLMKSIYRNVPATLETIRRVPVEDRTPDETLTRLGKLSEVWATLPNMPGNNKPFAAGKITRADVDDLLNDLEAKLKTFSGCDQEFQTVAGALNELDAGHVDFISGALTQGRKQFEPDTAERRVIEAIPTPASPATPAAPPEAAVNPHAAPIGAAPSNAVPINPAQASKDAPTTTPVNFTPPPKAVNE